MKKLAILLLALAVLCSCFVLAACSGDNGDSSSAASGADESSKATSSDNSSSAASSTATSSEETSSAASSEDESSVAEPSEDESSADESSVETSDDSSAEESSDDTSSEETSSGGEVATGNPLWVTHYNTISNEGSGAILSEPYEGGAWWLAVSFKPVDGKDGVYEVVEVLDGPAGGGNGVPLNIPEGGFVYALNSGNDYPGSGDNSKPDYTSAACDASVAAAQSWKAGDQFTFTGIDFANFTDVPTTTPDLQWYEDGDYDYGNYVCTATYTKVN